VNILVIKSPVWLTFKIFKHLKILRLWKKNLTTGVIVGEGFFKLDTNRATQACRLAYKFLKKQKKSLGQKFFSLRVVDLLNGSG